MTFSAKGPRFPDVNVWITLVSSRHEHHLFARAWLDSFAGEVCFCRITQMGLLRLLTNTHVMEEDVLKPASAWQVYQDLLADSRVRFVPEPLGVERAWAELMTSPGVGRTAWIDAYLAAFAIEMGFRLVTLDRGMRRWSGLAPEVLGREF